MGKFNKRGQEITLTENLAGGEAFQESPKLEFVSILLTSFVQSQFYRCEEQGLNKVQSLIAKITDKKFPAKAAIFARNKYGMRSISHVVAGELAKNVKGEEWAKSFYNRVIYRADDILEILSYYLTNYGKPIPNSLKKGLRRAFDKFDEYQLAKYRKESASISLVDAVNLLHPIPTKRNEGALKKLIEGKLVSKDTWEVKLTQAGQKATSEEEKKELKEQAWKDLILEKKIGYFALLRNLRNIIEQAPEVLDKALELLVSEKLIKKSLVLPFRYLTAIGELQQVSGFRVRDILKALNTAIEISCNNVPKFEGDTLVVVDGSGSMSGKPMGIASLFAAILYKYNKADLMVFSGEASYVNLNPADSTLGLTAQIVEHCPGDGTDFKPIFKLANRPYNRVIILSDMQGWMDYMSPTRELNQYKTRHRCSPHVYSWDLQGYGTLQFPERQVYCLAGFSDKIFDMMALLESDRKALINEIEKVPL